MLWLGSRKSLQNLEYGYLSTILAFVNVLLKLLKFRGRHWHGKTFLLAKSYIKDGVFMYPCLWSRLFLIVYHCIRPEAQKGLKLRLMDHFCIQFHA